MPRFFVPDVTDDAAAERVWETTHKRLSDGGPVGPWVITGRRIYSISYTHSGKRYMATVGEPAPRTEQTVIAIFESDGYLICTGYPGIPEREPIWVGRASVEHVTDFDPE